MKTLEEQLAAVNDRIERLVATQATGVQMNPEGEIGGIRSRSARQKRRLMERYDREAAEHVRLSRERDEILAKMRGRDAAMRPPVNTDAWWDAIAVGDSVTLWSGATVTVAKKNRKSVVSAGGVRWTREEIAPGKRGAG